MKETPYYNDQGNDMATKTLPGIREDKSLPRLPGLSKGFSFSESEFQPPRDRPGSGNENAWISEAPSTQLAGLCDQSAGTSAGAGVMVDYMRCAFSSPGPGNDTKVYRYTQYETPLPPVQLQFAGILGHRQLEAPRVLSSQRHQNNHLPLQRFELLMKDDPWNHLAKDHYSGAQTPGAHLRAFDPKEGIFHGFTSMEEIICDPDYQGQPPNSRTFSPAPILSAGGRPLFREHEQYLITNDSINHGTVSGASTEISLRDEHSLENCSQSSTSGPKCINWSSTGSSYMSPACAVGLGDTESAFSHYCDDYEAPCDWREDYPNLCMTPTTYNSGNNYDLSMRDSPLNSYSSLCSTTTQSTPSGVPKKNRKRGEDLSSKREVYECRELKGCTETFSCNSLRKKHEMKHTRPYRCSHSNCKHSKGFTTKNDLGRHRRTVHGWSPRKGRSHPRFSNKDDAEFSSDRWGGYVYRCIYCIKNAKQEAFCSARKDNFRSHIRRIHMTLRKAGENVEAFLKSKPTSRCEPSSMDRHTTISGDHNSLHSGQQLSFSHLGEQIPLQSNCKRVTSPRIDVQDLCSDMQQPGISNLSRCEDRQFKKSQENPVQSQIIIAGGPVRSESPIGQQKRKDSPSRDKMSGLTNAPFEDPALASIALDKQRRLAGTKFVEVCKPPDFISNSAQKQRLLQEKVELEKRLEEVNLLLGNSREKPLAQQDESTAQWGLPKVQDIDRSTDSSLKLPPIKIPPPTRSPKSPGITTSTWSETGVTSPPTPTEPTYTYTPFSGNITQLQYPSPRPTPLHLEDWRTSPPAGLTGNPHLPPLLANAYLLESIRPRPPRLPKSPVPKPSGIAKSQPSHIHNSSRSSKRHKDRDVDKGEKCPHCTSCFALPCQLRKHLKRHTKPFGCTFTGCGKIFGAKNDWKRHENSQHHQLELWKCDLPSTETRGLCGKCHYRKADFVRHLKIVHQIPVSNPEEVVEENVDPLELLEREERRIVGIPGPFPTKESRTIKEIIKDCHIPKNHAGQFWCGFCVKPIKLKSYGSEGWDERFDHIADHFEKEGRRVEGNPPWIFCEETPNKPPESPILPPCKEVNTPQQIPPRGPGIPFTLHVSVPKNAWTCCKCNLGWNAEDDCRYCKDHKRCNHCAFWMT